MQNLTVCHLTGLDEMLCCCSSPPRHCRAKLSSERQKERTNNLAAVISIERSSTKDAQLAITVEMGQQRTKAQSGNFLFPTQPIWFIMPDSHQYGGVHGAQGCTGYDGRGVRCLVGCVQPHRGRRRERRR